MADYSQVSVNPIEAPANSYNPIAGVGVAPGQPVYQTATASEVALARANASGTTFPVGLCTKGATALERVNVQFAGPLTLPEAEWNTVTGSSTGLTPGAVYYVSSATAGMLTTVAPDVGGTFDAPVGIATSPTTMLVQISLATAG